MSFMITMSQKELHRLEVVQKIRDRRLSVVQAAEVLALWRSREQPVFGTQALATEKVPHIIRRSELRERNPDDQVSPKEKRAFEPWR